MALRRLTACGSALAFAQPARVVPAARRRCAIPAAAARARARGSFFGVALHFTPRWSAGIAQASSSAAANKTLGSGEQPKQQAAAELEQAVEQILESVVATAADSTPQLVSASLGDPRDKKAECKRVTLRPVLIKSGVALQFMHYCGTRVITKNYSLPEARDVLRRLLLDEFKQGQFFTETSDLHFICNVRTGRTTLSRKKPTKAAAAVAVAAGSGAAEGKDGRAALSVGLQHDRSKEHILREGEPVPFLVHLGVMTAEGRVVKAKYDKFRQVNRFLEHVRAVVPALQGAAEASGGSRPLRIIDFGSGKSYLTFALFHYLSSVMGLPVRVEGVDLKRDVVEGCEALSKALGTWPDLRFHTGDIQSFEGGAGGPVDMVVSLHACDTATDAALAQAVEWGAAAILAVPCCQKEALGQIRSEPLGALLRHGILKERVAALATDAARAALLTAAGYTTQVCEFIDMEGTPKNILIRALRGASAAQRARALREYRALAAALSIRPTTEASLARFFADVPEREGRPRAAGAGADVGSGTSTPTPAPDTAG
eukprot:tig00020710_g13317.t1